MLLLFIKMLPLVLMTLAGYVLNKRQVIDVAFNRQLSLVMLNVFYPCLIISSIVRSFTWASLLQNWMMPAGAVFILVTGWLVGRATLPLLRRHTEGTRRCYHFICLMNNYSFLPMLVAASLWGEMAVALVIFSGLGSELCVWTLGVKALTGQKLDRRFLRNLASVPMLALAGSIVILALRSLLAARGLLPAEGSVVQAFLGTVLDTCRLAGGATIPASALICGARIAMLHPNRILSPLMAGTCLLRLVVIPAVCVAGLLAVPMPVDVRRVLILIAVQPAAMASVTLAEAFNGDAEFSAAAILATHVLCLITIPLWLAAVLGGG
ncbi:MAG TPA: AEC family transporter [Kiritimatiellia bacterium]|nr:MAG: Membrane transport protein [Verrucomicrobia bacterium ADurb.Bin070]HPO38247.1 AEC family transporter [Kiritimatiellia bacterium]HQQ92669.1 AEC family transporter [Kiritimatiellia bacterium]